MRRKCHVVAAPSHAGGLFNQIESLLGYTYIALTKNATLALPPLAPHVVWPELVPFEDVFESFERDERQLSKLMRSLLAPSFLVGWEERGGDSNLR